MYAYWIIFLASGVVAMTGAWKPHRSRVLAATVAIILSIFIGYRFEVGADWPTYEIIFVDISRMSLIDSLRYGDAAYSLINWLVAQIDGRVWHVNLLCGMLFSYALVVFCDKSPRPGLVLVVAIPTLVIVAAMGYTRQATAVACIMLAYARFDGKIGWRWFGWLCLGVLFHKSAILVYPIFILAGSRNRWLSILVGGAAVVTFLGGIVARDLGDMLSLYFEGDLESSGTLPRLLVGVLAGGGFFLIRGREQIYGTRYVLIRNINLFAIGMLPIFFLIPSTTVVDRIGILLLPFQGMVYAGLAKSLEDHPSVETFFCVSIVGFYALLLAVWLLFANFAQYWIPYQNVFFLKYI